MCMSKKNLDPNHKCFSLLIFCSVIAIVLVVIIICLASASEALFIWNMVLSGKNASLSCNDKAFVFLLGIVSCVLFFIFILLGTGAIVAISSQRKQPDKKLREIFLESLKVAGVFVTGASAATILLYVILESAFTIVRG